MRGTAGSKPPTPGADSKRMTEAEPKALARAAPLSAWCSESEPRTGREERSYTLEEKSA